MRRLSSEPYFSETGPPAASSGLELAAPALRESEARDGCPLRRNPVWRDSFFERCVPNSVAGHGYARAFSLRQVVPSGIFGLGIWICSAPADQSRDRRPFVDVWTAICGLPTAGMSYPLNYGRRGPPAVALLIESLAKTGRPENGSGREGSDGVFSGGTEVAQDAGPE